MTQKTKPTLLVLDPNPECAEATSLLLGPHFECIRFSESPSEVPELVQNLKLDLVLSERDYFDVVRKELSESTEYVLMTSEVVSETQLKEQGAQFILYKPFEKEILLKTLTLAIRQSGKNEGGERINPRASVELKLRYRLPNQADYVDSKTLNLSRGGMFIRAAEGLVRLKQKISILLDLQENQTLPLKLIGTIQWIRQTPQNGLPEGFGVEFQQVTEENEQIISSFVQEKIG